jgi:hypothetical protein
MAMIKSALELALERTKDFAVDEAALAAQQLKVEGKKAAGKYLEDPSTVDLGNVIASTPKDKRKPLKEGMFENLASQLQLPANESSLVKLEILGKGFTALAEQVIRKQWGPKLREKEREMEARLGKSVRLDPMMDPEFSAFYKQNVGAARQQYQAALDKAKTDLAGLIGI